MRISDWSSDVCSSDLVHGARQIQPLLFLVVVAQAGRQCHQIAFGGADIGLGMLQLDEVLVVGRLREPRSEEHTSELQSLMRISYAVFCLKKKTKKTYRDSYAIYRNSLYINMKN